MTPEIFTGFDCGKDYQYPTRKPRIYPRNITMATGESVDLQLLKTHPYCDPACYKWQIVRGGGYLIGDFGIENIYYAPSENDKCEASPCIEVSTGGKVLDRISIGVTGFVKPVPAIVQALEWKQPEVDLQKLYPHLVGLPYCDKDPRVHYWTLWIDEYGCDGSRTARHHIGLVSQLVEAWCGIKIYTDRFVQLRLIGETVHHFGYPIWFGLEEVKKRVLRYWKEDYLFTLASRLYWGFGIEAPRWPKDKTFVLNPNGILDVRMDKVIAMDCCPNLLAVLQHQET